MIASQRPGVYSEYVSSGIYKGNSTACVGIVAANSVASTKQTYEVSRTSEAKMYFGEAGLMYRLCCLALSNGANKIICASAANGSTEEYQKAFALLENTEHISCVICDSTSEEINSLLKESVVNSSEKSRERIAIAACEESYAESFASISNCERLMLISQKVSDAIDEISSSCFLAAALAGKIVSFDDPSQSLNGTALSGISNLDRALSEDEIDSYLQAGVTVFETIAGSIEVVRAVSTRTHTDGVSDRTFHDINVVLIIDDVIKDIRQALKAMVSHSKNNEATRTAIATQACVVLEEKKNNEIIYSYQTPVVTVDKDDPTACLVELEFTAAQSVSQILITAYISV